MPSPQVPGTGTSLLIVKKALNPLAAGERVNKKCLTKCVCHKYSGSYTSGAGAEDEARVALPFGIGLGILSGWVRLRLVVAWVLCQGTHRAQGCCLHLGGSSALHLFYYSAGTLFSI